MYNLECKTKCNDFGSVYRLKNVRTQASGVFLRHAIYTEHTIAVSSQGIQRIVAVLVVNSSDRRFLQCIPRK